MNKIIIGVLLGLVVVVIVVITGFAAMQDGPNSSLTPDNTGSEIYLITDTPDEGFSLALLLARRGVTETQPDTVVLHALRPGYANEAEPLIAASHVVAVHLQTVAAANDYWR